MSELPRLIGGIVDSSYNRVLANMTPLNVEERNLLDEMYQHVKDDSYRYDQNYRDVILAYIETFDSSVVNYNDRGVIYFCGLLLFGLNPLKQN